MGIYTKPLQQQNPIFQDFFPSFWVISIAELRSRIPILRMKLLSKQTCTGQRLKLSWFGELPDVVCQKLLKNAKSNS